MPPIYLIDASPYIFRAYFSIPSSIRTPEGAPANAVYGYTAFLLDLLKREQPSHLAVAFDGSLTTSFRNEIYPAYKAQRELPPAELEAQLDACLEVTKALGMAAYIDDRFEADDIIGTLIAKLAKHEGKFVVVSGDKDLAQLVNKRVALWDFAKDRRFDEKAVKQHFGVRPNQIIDLLALMGDAVDNIPGVKGIGEVTAKKLIAEYHDLDNLYAHLPQISASIRTKLHDQKDMAYLSRKLVTLQTDVAISTDTSNLSRGPVDAKELYRHFSDLEFHNLLKRIPQIAKSDAPLPTSIPQQSPQGQYHLIRDLDGLSDVIATCRHAGQLFFHPLFEYDEIRPHYFAFALSHGTQQAWIAIPQNFSPALSTPQAQPPHTTPDLFATSSQSPLSTEPPTTSQTNDLSDLPLFAVAFSPSPPTQRPNPPMT
ncbi:hypothetical protein HUU40_03050, partial [candidate division KSB1 bacterium]|nr:hypothetical protein [candidate division KSB1 bacterium]